MAVRTINFSLMLTMSRKPAAHLSMSLEQKHTHAHINSEKSPQPFLFCSRTVNFYKMWIRGSIFAQVLFWAILYPTRINNSPMHSTQLKKNLLSFSTTDRAVAAMNILFRRCSNSRTALMSKLITSCRSAAYPGNVKDQDSEITCESFSWNPVWRYGSAICYFYPASAIRNPY